MGTAKGSYKFNVITQDATVKHTVISMRPSLFVVAI